MKPPKRLGNMQYPPVQSICKSTLSIAISNVLATWNPLFLYRGTGIGGCWLDPSDMSTMFQDAAGTTPVTAMEQPVGLWLDKSKGLELGPELVSNGDFNNGTAGWSPEVGAILNVSNGVMTVTSDSGGFDAAAQTVNTTANTYYEVVCNKLVGGATAGKLRVYSSSGKELARAAYTSSVAQKLRLVFLADTATVIVQMFVDTVNSFASFDNISVREIKGNHATQSVTASRPVVSARYNVLLGTDSPVTQSVTASGVPAVLSFYGTGSVTLSGAYTGVLNGTGADNRVSLNFTPSAASLTLTISGSVTKIMLHRGSSLLPYQRVNTATDYDTVGFKKYLKFDGVDDYLNLPYLGLYLNGSASIVAARDALSQATDTYVISERSASNVNPKYFPSRQLANAGNMDSYIVNDAGTVVVDTVGSAYGGASGAVIRSVIDSGNNIKLFKNGALAANDNYARSGTLTLTNTTIGASVSTTTSNYANMRLYGLVITKSALSDSERRRVERLLAYNSGAQI